jgi:hypothetical protein
VAQGEWNEARVAQQAYVYQTRTDSGSGSGA